MELPLGVIGRGGETTPCLPSPCYCKGRKKTKGSEPIVPSLYKVEEHRAMSKARDKGHGLRSGLNAVPQSTRTIGAETRFYGVPGQNIKPFFSAAVPSAQPKTPVSGLMY